MNEQMYCYILNRIRKLAKENGEDPADVAIKITLLNGDKIFTEAGNCNRIGDGDILEAWDGEIVFVPLKNILSISC